jgi:hypothetical protein
MAARPGSGLALRIRVFLTGSGTSAASGGPDWEVCVGRPIVRALLDELVDSDDASSVGSVKDAEHGTGARGGGGGYAVFAAGPSGLVREAGNAAARVNLCRRAGVDFCAEPYVI